MVTINDYYGWTIDHSIILKPATQLGNQTIQSVVLAWKIILSKSKFFIFYGLDIIIINESFVHNIFYKLFRHLCPFYSNLFCKIQFLVN